MSFARHTQALLGSVGRVARNQFATALTLLVIGLALALPLALNLFVTNAQTATGGFADAVDMSVYFKTDVALAKAQQLAADARQRSEVAAVSLIPADKALDEFRTYSGFGAALEALKENPLPHVLHVRPKPEYSSPGALESLRRYFAAWPEVDIVQIDSDWVMRFNTIRLEILNRRAEIEVTKLVGGSNSFVRRPFLYTGVLYGLGGAVLGWLIVEAAVAILGQPVATLAQLYGSRYSMQGPTGNEILIVLGAGIVLGWLGAWISAARHLRSIEPRA